MLKDNIANTICDCGKSGLLKVLIGILIIIFFSKTFLFSSDSEWGAKYKIFNVPANTYPGGDSRNIQAAADCLKNGTVIFEEQECVRSGKIVKRSYIDAAVPLYNYPSMWAIMYSLFDDSSEEFFMAFWRLNAFFLMATIFVYGIKYDFIYFPIFLLSPITLLTIERGNIDATTFFFTFFSLFFFFRFKLVASFFIGFSSALKIFPFFCYLAFLGKKKLLFDRNIIMGFLLSLPVIIFSFLEIPYLVEATSKGFDAAYGLFSLEHSLLFKNNPIFVYAIIVLFSLFWLTSLIYMSSIGAVYREVDRGLRLIGEKELVILMASAAIFIFTFMLFTNWAYRLIFLIPAFFVLPSFYSIFFKIIRINILAIFWVPAVFDNGWYIQNILCFPLVILLSFVMLRWIFITFLSNGYVAISGCR